MKNKIEQKPPATSGEDLDRVANAIENLPRYSLDESGKVVADESSLTHILKLSKTTGFRNPTNAEKAIRQIANVIQAPDAKSKMEQAVAIFSEMNPKDSTETMLMGQMIAVHELTQQMMGRAANSEHEQITDFALNKAHKLMKTFLAQVEALNKYRGKGQQKVTVEHVTVESGGKAFVGNAGGKNSDEKA